jgi:glycosyltransferase 2 family protein
MDIIREILSSKCIKILFFIVSLIFITKVGFENYDAISSRREIIVDNISLLLFFAFVYLMLQSMLAWGWKSVLQGESKSNLGMGLVAVYLKTSIFKYIPGNIFHLIGRQFAAKKYGLTDKVILFSSLVEILVLILSSLSLSFVVVMFYYGSFSFLNDGMKFYIKAMITLFFAILFCVSFFLGVVNKYLNILFFYFLCTVFFIIVGVITYFIAKDLLNINLSLQQAVVFYSISWVVGFVIPGAPGGIGIRESIFILLSGGVIQEGDAFVLVALLRIINLLGEILGFLLASMYLAKK